MYVSNYDTWIDLGTYVIFETMSTNLIGHQKKNDKTKIFLRHLRELLLKLEYMKKNCS